MEPETSLDALDELFWGGSSKANAPEETPTQGISFEEWRWLAMDKQLDEIRKKNGLRPFGEKRREKDLSSYLAEVERRRKDSEVV